MTIVLTNKICLLALLGALLLSASEATFLSNLHRHQKELDEAVTPAPPCTAEDDGGCRGMGTIIRAVVAQCVSKTDGNQQNAQERRANLGKIGHVPNPGFGKYPPEIVRLSESRRRSGCFTASIHTTMRSIVLGKGDTEFEGQAGEWDAGLGICCECLDKYLAECTGPTCVKNFLCAQSAICPDFHAKLQCPLPPSLLEEKVEDAQVSNASALLKRSGVKAQQLGVDAKSIDDDDDVNGGGHKWMRKGTSLLDETLGSKC